MMSDEEIIERFDTDWDITVERLAQMAHRTVGYVRNLLMEEKETEDES